MRTLILILILTLPTAACESMFEVENPNELIQGDLERPQAAPALVNGAEATLARALGYLVLPASVAGDELTSIGTFDAGVELDGGFLSNPANEYANNAWPFVAEARFQADEAVRLLEIFDGDGTLADRAQLSRAHLYAGIIYTYVPDHFDDFVVSNRSEAAPPVGPEEMAGLYEIALEHLDRAVAVARETGRADLELAALAQRARTRHARVVWKKLNPAGAVPSDPWVADAGARDDAIAALALIPDTDWALRLEYGVGTVPNQLGNQVNIRQEFRVDDPYAVPGPDGKGVVGVALEDPVSGAPDQALAGAMAEFTAGGEYPSLTVVSARELRLIAAEVALARGEIEDAVAQIDRIRTLDGRAEAAGHLATAEGGAGGGTAARLLRHERRVSLFLQGRRLADQYRFGIRDARWLESSDAFRVPGTFLPITEVERISNCHLAGTC